jgi:hypothetical protein
MNAARFLGAASARAALGTATDGRHALKYVLMSRERESGALSRLVEKKNPAMGRGV